MFVRIILVVKIFHIISALFTIRNINDTSMSTLEDKILGEKLHYYCSSSSEDEENDSRDSDKDSDNERYPSAITESSVEPSFSEWDGTSSNTGPKGVIKVYCVLKYLI